MIKTLTTKADTSAAFGGLTAAADPSVIAPGDTLTVRVSATALQGLTEASAAIGSGRFPTTPRPTPSASLSSTSTSLRPRRPAIAQLTPPTTLSAVVWAA